MEENTTVYSFSDNTSIGFDVNNMNNNTTNGVPAGNLFIRLLATSHIMFKIGEYDLFITGRNEVVAKVIFLHLSVILFTGGVCLLGGCLVPGGVWSPGDVWSWGVFLLRGFLLLRRCLVPRGSGPRWVWSGGCLLPRGYPPNFFLKFFFLTFFYYDFLLLLGIPPSPRS